MCIVFSGQTVYDYVFAREEADGLPMLVSRSAITAFCSALNDDIVAHAIENPQYKYVYFNFNEESLARLFASHPDKYVDMFNVTLCSVSLAGTIEETAHAYNDDPVIIEALDNAYRLAFSAREDKAA